MIGCFLVLSVLQCAMCRESRHFPEIARRRDGEQAASLWLTILTCYVNRRRLSKRRSTGLWSLDPVWVPINPCWTECTMLRPYQSCLDVIGVVSKGAPSDSPRLPGPTTVSFRNSATPVQDASDSCLMPCRSLVYSDSPWESRLGRHSLVILWGNRARFFFSLYCNKTFISLCVVPCLSFCFFIQPDSQLTLKLGCRFLL